MYAIVYGCARSDYDLRYVSNFTHVRVIAILALVLRDAASPYVDAGVVAVVVVD